jgi:hypothetical protein
MTPECIGDHSRLDIDDDDVADLPATHADACAQAEVAPLAVDPIAVDRVERRRSRRQYSAT